MADDVSTEKKERKSLKDDAKPSRGHMLAIWAALATALGSQGVPSIVRMLSDKPDVEDVQMMIANQTAKLTVQQNNAVEAIRDLHSEMKKLDSSVSHVRGRIEVLRELTFKCCTNGKSRRKEFYERKTREGKERTSIETKIRKDNATRHAYSPHKISGQGVLERLEQKKDYVEQLQKVPDFNLRKIENLTQQALPKE